MYIRSQVKMEHGEFAPCVYFRSEIGGTTLKKYAICETANREYAAFLLYLTFDGLLASLSLIEKEPLVLHSDGTLLIDQLLITGNGRNRFLNCPFSNGKFIMSGFENVLPSQYYRKLSADLLQENYSLLHNSILTDAQKALITAGIPI